MVTQSHTLKCGAFSLMLTRNRNLSVAFVFITQAVWWCYNRLSLNQHGMSEISACVQVGIKIG